MNSHFGWRYEVQRQLGKKAGRQTLLCRDLTTADFVVVKLLTFGNEFEWDDLKLFKREAETLKSLSHPFIPRYLDYFEINSATSRGFALVQTYIPAQTLEQYLLSGHTFTLSEVKEIAKAILEILVYLHGQNPPIIHRDIKPSNILLTNRSGNSVGEVYLVDFGSVQTLAATEGSTMTVVGTYGYMPPEQFGGRTVAASDLYSLGATLIYLVTGKHPADLPQKDLRIQFEQFTNLDSVFTDWLRWMSEPSLDRRLTTAPEALKALESPRSRTTITLTVDQPVGSKIKLIKDENSFLILIPPAGFKLSMTSIILFTVAWNSFVFFWTISVLAAPFPVNIPFALFSLPFWGAGLQMLYGIFSSLFKRTQLHLNRENIGFTSDLLGFKFNHVPKTSSKNITKLVYLPRTFTTDSEGKRIEIPPQLTIYAGVHKYKLGGSGCPIESEIEMQWLAHELSNWLSLSVERE